MNPSPLTAHPRRTMRPAGPFAAVALAAALAAAHSLPPAASADIRESLLKERGIEGQKAPKLNVFDWIHLPEGKERVELSDYEGRVVVMLFFQHWCEASQEEALPTFKRLLDKFGEREEIAFLVVQTVFQGFTENTPDKLVVAAEKFGIEVPMGHSVKTDAFPGISGAYKAGGTPWWVIINKEHVVEYDGFYLNPDIAEENLAEMLDGE